MQMGDLGQAKSGLSTRGRGLASLARYAALPLVLSSLVCAACGGSSAQSAEPAAPSATPAESAAAEPTPDAAPAALAKEDGAAPAPAATPAADKAPQAEAPVHDKTPSSQAPRQVDYRVTPDGLIIEVDGVTLKPKAKSVKVKGGFGVEVTVTVTTDKLRFLTNPDNGPLMFAGNVSQKKDSNRFNDERHGDAVMNLEPGVTKTITRTFPGPGQKALLWGQTLELEAGLWGLGNDEERRPLNKLFKLKMEAKEGATPVISPPMN